MKNSKGMVWTKVTYGIHLLTIGIVTTEDRLSGERQQNGCDWFTPVLASNNICWAAVKLPEADRAVWYPYGESWTWGLFGMCLWLLHRLLNGLLPIQSTFIWGISRDPEQLTLRIFLWQHLGHKTWHEFTSCCLLPDVLSLWFKVGGENTYVALLTENGSCMSWDNHM